jgi:plastocyanin
MALDAIERAPAISLSCRPEFRQVELAQNLRPPEDTLLLTEAGGQWVHVGGTLDKKRAASESAAPEPFARCAVSNYGRFPALNIRVPVHLTFKDAAGTAKPATATADIPGLSAGGTYEFSMLNGTAKSLTFAYDDHITMTRIDTHVTGEAPLYTDRRVADLQRQSFGGTLAALPGAPTTIVLQNFSFRPAELHVKIGDTVRFLNHDAEAHEIVTDGKDAFASGAIDPHGDWKHTFAKAGRYAVYCDYHPYMKAMVVVE